MKVKREVEVTRAFLNGKPNSSSAKTLKLYQPLITNFKQDLLSLKENNPEHVEALLNNVRQNPENFVMFENLESLLARSLPWVDGFVLFSNTGEFYVLPINARKALFNALYNAFKKLQSRQSSNEKPLKQSLEWIVNVTPTIIDAKQDIESFLEFLASKNVKDQGLNISVLYMPEEHFHKDYVFKLVSKVKDLNFYLGFAENTVKPLTSILEFENVLELLNYQSLRRHVSGVLLSVSSTSGNLSKLEALSFYNDLTLVLECDAYAPRIDRFLKHKPLIMSGGLINAYPSKIYHLTSQPLTDQGFLTLSNNLHGFGLLNLLSLRLKDHAQGRVAGLKQVVFNVLKSYQEGINKQVQEPVVFNVYKHVFEGLEFDENIDRVSKLLNDYF
ncbi:hypothetical protein J7L02_01070 [Candidatus Woesearchaeota archaeon]|nr:hypothetical protein [Candidatus Woesearchaeota archaeon]